MVVYDKSWEGQHFLRVLCRLRYVTNFVVSDIPPGRLTNDRRQLFCLDKDQQSLCFYPYGTRGLQFSVRAFVMDPRLQNNVTEHSFIGSIPHYLFHDFTSDQLTNFSQVEISINAESPNSNLSFKWKVDRYCFFFRNNNFL
jgi:uncharacterized protein YbaA (DUF1428 family)